MTRKKCFLCNELVNYADFQWLPMMLKSNGGICVGCQTEIITALRVDNIMPAVSRCAMYDMALRSKKDQGLLQVQCFVCEM